MLEGRHFGGPPDETFIVNATVTAFGANALNVNMTINTKNIIAQVIRDPKARIGFLVKIVNGLTFLDFL